MNKKDKNEQLSEEAVTETPVDAALPEGTAEEKLEDVILDGASYKALCERASQGDAAHDTMLRAQADLENTKKRLMKQMQGAVQYANEELVGGLLDVLDSFDRALESLPDKNEDDPFYQGLTMINSQLHAVLEKAGLRRIVVVGKLFDPHQHEAIAYEERADCPDHTVIGEISAGYRFKDRLLRPARVQVSRSPGDTGSEENTLQEGNA